MSGWSCARVNADPFPFRVGAVRLAYPGTLNGVRAEYDPREKYEATIWAGSYE